MFTIAVNMEFCRSADKSFEQGVEIAAGLGYRHIEPMVHTGWELLSEVGYFHSFSIGGPAADARHLRPSRRRGCSLSGHSPLMKPEAAIPRLTRAIVLADALGARWVNTDEMLKPDWLDDDFAHEVMRYTLTRADQVARRHGVDICVEPHGVYTKTAAGLRRIVELVPSDDRCQLGHRAARPARRTLTRRSSRSPSSCATCTPRTFRWNTPSASAAW